MYLRNCLQWSQRALYWLPNNTFKQHKALKSVTIEPISVTSLHNRRFMSQARRMWHFALSNFFLVEGLSVALSKFCTSLVILPRKMEIDFYTYKLRCLTKYNFPHVDPFVVTNQAKYQAVLGNL